MNQTHVIDVYQDSLNDFTQEDLEEIKDKASEYNQSLTGETSFIEDPFAETDEAEVSAMDVTSSFNVFTDSLGEVLGYIDIPDIEAYLPIYAGTSDAVLQKGIGLFENTSFPTGGGGTHSVLTGHRGLPTSKLFTDLPDVAIGNVFYLHVLDEVLAYEVKETQVVLPYETDHIAIQEGKDLVTLITCTPYMINTHRLLVTGERIPYTPEEELVSSKETDLPLSPLITIFLPAIILLTLLISFIWYQKKKRGVNLNE